MDSKFWEEYITNSVDILKKAIFIGALALLYSFIPDLISVDSETRYTVIALRSFSIIYLVGIILFLKFREVSLRKVKNYYYFIYSIFIVILVSALTIGFITERLVTFYFFVIIELELFYAVLTLTRIKVFTFFVVLGNLIYFTFVYFSDELINGAAYSIFSSTLIMAPLAIFIQYQILEYHKKEYLKRKKLSLEINQKEQAQLRLLEAKEIAEKANNSKSLFIANLSHEVRTPMHAIMNYSRMGIKKLDDLDKEKVKHYFNQINTSGDRLLLLVEELLEFARLENAHTSYNSQLNDISITIEKVLKELQVLSDKKDISFVVENQDTNNMVAYDEIKIIQVFLNIIANAIKFSPKESVINIKIEDTKDDFVLIKIIDNGIGIEKSELRYIFNDFTQGSRTKTIKKGTGLGLSISKKIVEGHGGKIWALNNKNRGASFCFTLPKNV